MKPIIMRIKLLLRTCTFHFSKTELSLLSRRKSIHIDKFPEQLEQKILVLENQTTVLRVYATANHIERLM